MAEMEKKMAAALAAVNAYMQQEEETVCAQMAASVGTPTPVGHVNMWGISGRQEMMAMRRMIQLRAFNRIR